MVYLETIVALAFMTYIVDLDVDESHPGMKKYSTTLLMNAKVLHYTHDRDSLLLKSIFVYLC